LEPKGWLPRLQFWTLFSSTNFQSASPETYFLEIHFNIVLPYEPTSPQEGSSLKIFWLKFLYAFPTPFSLYVQPNSSFWPYHHKKKMWRRKQNVELLWSFFHFLCLRSKELTIKIFTPLKPNNYLSHIVTCISVWVDCRLNLLTTDRSTRAHAMPSQSAPTSRFLETDPNSWDHSAFVLTSLLSGDDHITRTTYSSRHKRTCNCLGYDISARTL
jgi:hypothetical protein